MALHELRAEHHGHFLIVLRRDPDIATFTVEHIQAVIRAIKAKCQGTRRRTEILLDPGVHEFFVDLHALQVQATHLTGEMSGRHLLVMLGPAGCGTHLFADVGGAESLYLKRTFRCHERLFMHSFGAFYPAKSG
ncbi:hypothetical protein D3C80_1361580 [compost metagenome]